MEEIKSKLIDMGFEKEDLGIYVENNKYNMQIEISVQYKFISIYKNDVLVELSDINKQLELFWLIFDFLTGRNK